MSPEEIEQVEIDLLLEALFRRYGYDFRCYSRPSIERTIRAYLKRSARSHPSTLIPDLMHDRKLFDEFVREFSITVSTMFRDPAVFHELRTRVFPWLRTHPFFRIWHAGCATGEEVYSLAILLQEANLYERATIFATDFNDHALENAARGIYSISKAQEFTKNYIACGGAQSFSDYYHAKGDHIVMKRGLRNRITFANHNLVVDEVFSEVHLVLCRNVLIYFGPELQQRALRLFNESLARGSFLCLGRSESIPSTTTSGFQRETNTLPLYVKTQPHQLALNSAQSRSS